MALSEAGKSSERSGDQGRDIRHLARWARGYAQRLDPINRIAETVAEFKDVDEAE
jgi:hypothetical protein